MRASTITKFLAGPRKGWYKSEKDTAALVKAVLKENPAAELSGDDIWNLVRLTWVNVYGPKTTLTHWKHLKVPALAAIFGRKPIIGGDLDSTIANLQLSTRVAAAAVQITGMVNFRGTWRNAAHTWCKQRVPVLRSIIDDACHLPANDQARFDLALRISNLPKIPSPSGVVPVRPERFLTPLVACLDPRSRFPIINGNDQVLALLSSLGLRSETLETKVRGLVNLIGQYGIEDAFQLDVWADEITKLEPMPPRSEAKPVGAGSPLPYFDDSERTATRKSGEYTYRALHNTMTNRVTALLKTFEPTRETVQHCQYDVLLSNYDRNGRDLLIEAKPDPDRGSIRIAVGQLFDYRRHLPRRAGTDLALLTIGPPTQSYIELLEDLQITLMWFTDKTCKTMKGSGKAWASIEAAI